MESNATVAPKRIYYNSLYRHEVDDKRRVQIPAKWRPSSADVEFTLMVWPKHQEGPCLRVLPPEQMDSLMQELVSMPSADPNKPVLKRIIGSESTQVAVDKVGRICIPDEMAKAAGIADKAVLVGLLDRFEIWSPERHARMKVADAVMAQEAFKLME